MKLPIYQVDAFSDHLFGGNPAAVCPLDTWLEDSMMQAIAAENNLSETAFFLSKGTEYEIRWFTPVYEVDLCGHATLASGHVIFSHLGHEGTSISLHSRSGLLQVKKEDDLLVLNFPADVVDLAEAPEGLLESVGGNPTQILRGKTDYMLIYESQAEVEALTPNFHQLGQVEARGVIATAPGNEVDFISRFFAPAAGVNEDPVTGSAHTSLIPYWSKRLEKKTMQAKQLSKRGGKLTCRHHGDRVEIAGQAQTYLIGEIQLN